MKWSWNVSEKHNHSLSSINSLLEKKNHCIMIVSLSNETITYVNQQTEEKDAKMLKRARQESVIITIQQTSCNYHFIKHLSHKTRLQTSSSLSLSDLHWDVKTENWKMTDCAKNISEQLERLTKQYIIKIECIAKRFTFRISLTMSLTVIISLRMSFWISRNSSLWAFSRWLFTHVAVINFL